MLSLWYIILGWKEYNKPFIKRDQGARPTDPVRTQDLISPKKIDIVTPQPSKTIAINQRPPAAPPRSSDSSDVNNKGPDVPQPKEVPKAPEITKRPEPPKVTPKTPETLKTPEFKLAPDTPKMPESQKFHSGIPKTPESPNSKFGAPKGPETPKTADGLPNVIPSRRPDSVVPDFPPSGRNPAYVPSSNPSEFSLPPYLPGTPTSRDDQLFTMGSTFSNPNANKPLGNLRDLSYPKGEFPEDDITSKVQDRLSKIPKYMEQSVISNPDSLESEEDDDD